MELIGWLSTVFLAACGFPLAVRAIWNGHARKEEPIFLTMWSIGEVFGLAYVIYLGSMPLIFNFGFNTLFLSIVWYYKFWERE